MVLLESELRIPDPEPGTEPEHELRIENLEG
jgi:hypothetical protein